LRVLVTGASGYVGSRLVPRLLDEGHDVRVSVTHDPDPDKLWWLDHVEVARMDVLDADEVAAAVDGVDAVYYLIHGMGGDDFADTDRQAAQNMLRAIDKHAVARVVYLSGIVPPEDADDLSEHIGSRLEVERILAGAGDATTVVTLRAAVLLGAASTSFEIVRQISDRLPVETMPTWMDSDVQPIAIVDALDALVGALGVETPTRSYDIGGTERLGYGDLIRLYADVAGLKRIQVPVPLLPTALVAKLAGLLTDVPAPTVEALVESLRHDMVCGDDQFRTDLLPAGHRLLDVRESIVRALQPADRTVAPRDRDPMGPMPQDPGWAHTER
jgi:uncharacterized protein YbjT (DUF2867 family)